MIYYSGILKAFLKGRLNPEKQSLLGLNEDEPYTDQTEQKIVKYCRKHDIKIHQFKKTMDLPRVKKVLGILAGIYPGLLLDIGFGRGAFLWSLLERFPDLDITALEKQEDFVKDVRTINKGGIDNINGIIGDVEQLPFQNDSFDVVTILEVLEHLPGYAKALQEVIRVAKQFVIISVPSHEDNNPEHIHLLSKDTLTGVLHDLGQKKLSISYVHNHMIVVVNLN